MGFLKKFKWWEDNDSDMDEEIENKEGAENTESRIVEVGTAMDSYLDTMNNFENFIKERMSNLDYEVERSIKIINFEARIIFYECSMYGMYYKFDSMEHEKINISKYLEKYKDKGYSIEVVFDVIDKESVFLNKVRLNWADPNNQYARYSFFTHDYLVRVDCVESLQRLKDYSENHNLIRKNDSFYYAPIWNDIPCFVE